MKKSKGIFQQIREKPFIKTKRNGLNIVMVPFPEFDCNGHQFQKTNPSKLDKQGVLLWECLYCKKQVSST